MKKKKEENEDDVMRYMAYDPDDGGNIGTSFCLADVEQAARDEIRNGSGTLIIYRAIKVFSIEVKEEKV